MPPIQYGTIHRNIAYFGYNTISQIFDTIRYVTGLSREKRKKMKKKYLYYAGCTVAVSYNKYHTVSQKISFRISVVVVVVVVVADLMAGCSKS